MGSEMCIRDRPCHAGYFWKIYLCYNTAAGVLLCHNCNYSAAINTFCAANSGSLHSNRNLPWSLDETHRINRKKGTTIRSKCLLCRILQDLCILAESQLGPWTGSTVSAEERVLPSAVIHFAASACCAAYFRIFA